MITKTDALVLKSMRYRDTSKIVTFYTRRYGKLKAIAKGARDFKNKFGAALEPMTLSSLVLYKKEHRELQLVSQCDIVRPYKRIHSEMERMSVALSTLDLVNQVTHDEEENLALFSLLIGTFDSLEDSTKGLENFFYAFEVRLAGLFGFGLNVRKCIECGKAIEFDESARPLLFDTSKGGLYCQDCLTKRGSDRFQPRSKCRISAQTVKILERLIHDRLESISNLEINEAVGNEVEEILRLYLQYHIEGLKPLRSRKVFEKINV